MNNKLLQYHLKALDALRESYDSEAHMMKSFIDNENGYHTQLKKGWVHPICPTSEFAIGLLDGGREEDIKEAENIILKIISIQDRREDKNTYGLWPYFYEESVDEMAPPDWNMACFNAIPLINAWLDYRQYFKKSTVEKIEQCCIAASECIMKRDVELGYTNVCVMTCYVTLLVGELLNYKKSYEYGMDKLKKFYNYTVYHNAFDEYNSPTYSVVLVNILGLMMQHIKNEKAREMIVELNDMAWKMIAEHYHIATNEWIGPHLRAYSDYIGDGLKTMIELALDSEIELTKNKKIGHMTMRYNTVCPQKYKKYFVDKNRKQSIRKMICAGFNYPWFGHSRGEMNYITPKYAMSSFDRCLMWNQHRPFSLYAGDENNKYCIRLRLLHDDFDFSGALMTSVQYENNFISQINYIPNGGDKHSGLDKIKNGTIHSKDFRYRVQISGNPDGVDIKADGANAEVKVCGLNIKFGFSHITFGDYKVKFEVNKDENGVYFDAVLVSGEADICFTDMKEAVAVFYLSVDSNKFSLPESVVNEDEITTVWNADDNEFKLNTFNSSHNFIETAMKHRQYLNGEWIEKLEAECPLG